MLPIVQRELLVAALSPRLYAWRMRVGILITLGTAGIFLLGAMSQSSAPAQNLFQAVPFIALIFCVFEGLRKTSDALSQEKRQGTLGLLFLTTLSGGDIVLGKLTAAAIKSLTALLSIVPFLAVSLLLGGTTGGEFWRTALVLVISLAASLSVCLMVTALSRERYIGASLGVLAALLLVPVLIAVPLGSWGSAWILPANPFYLLVTAFDSYYSRSPWPYWVGVAWLTFVTGGSVAIASLVLPRSWQERPVGVRAEKRPPTKASAKAILRRRALLDQNRVMWLLLNPGRDGSFRRLVGVIGVIALLGILGIHLALAHWADSWPPGAVLALPSLVSVGLILVTWLYVARESSRNLAETRENGALELLLSTPVRVTEIIQGQWLAIRSTIRPAFILLCILAAYISLASYYLEIRRGLEILVALKGFAEAILGVAAITWTGMWMGLTSKTPARAFFKTVLLGLVLPFVVCTPTLVNQLILLVLAVEKVQSQFRKFVAERYFQSSPFWLSPVSPQSPHSPPVLRR